MKKVVDNVKLNSFLVIALGIIIGITVSTSIFCGILLTIAFLVEMACAINLVRLSRKMKNERK